MYYSEKICKLNEIGTLIDGAAGNINQASLGELQRAGIISDKAVLDGELKWKDEEGNNRTTELKKMSLAELITAVSYISEQQSNIPQMP